MTTGNNQKQSRQNKMDQQTKIMDKTNIKGPPPSSALVPACPDNKKKAALKEKKKLTTKKAATMTAAAAAALKNNGDTSTVIPMNNPKAYAANNGRKSLSVENIKHARKIRIDEPTKKSTMIWDENEGAKRSLQKLYDYTAPVQPHLGLPLELCLLYKDRIVLPYDHDRIDEILRGILKDLFGSTGAVIDAMKDEEHRGMSYIINMILQSYDIDNKTLEDYLKKLLFNEKIGTMNLVKANNNRKGFTESNLRQIRTVLLQEKVPKTLWIEKYDGKPGETRQLRDMSIYEAPKKPHLDFPIDICVTIRNRPIIPIDYGRTGSDDDDDDDDDDNSQLHTLLTRLSKELDLPDMDVLVPFMMTNPKRIVPIILEKFLELYVIENATLINFFTSRRHFMGVDDSRRTFGAERVAAFDATLTHRMTNLTVGSGSGSTAGNSSNRTTADVDRVLLALTETIKKVGASSTATTDNLLTFSRQQAYFNTEIVKPKRVH